MRLLPILLLVSTLAALLAGCGEAIDDSDTAQARSTQRSYAFLQDNIIHTGNGMDLAINGRGLLMFREDGGREVYSRNGALRVNHLGEVVSLTGQRLLGKVWDEQLGVSVGPLVPVQVQVPRGGYPVATGEGPVKAERGVQIGLNLDAAAKVIPEAVPAIRFNDPATYNFSTVHEVYDGQGARLALNQYFQKVAVNRWRVFATIDGVPLDQPQGVPYDPTSHDPAPLLQLEFGADGRMLPSSRSQAVVAVNDPRPGAPAAVLFPALPVRADPATTQFSSAFMVWLLKQDGFRWGALVGIHFGPDGAVNASYSNGHVRKTYQLHLAEFPNLAGLAPAGTHFWTSAPQAGEKIALPAGSGSAGVIEANALEERFVTRPVVTSACTVVTTATPGAVASALIHRPC